MPKVIGAKELKSRLQTNPEGAYLFFGEEEHLKRVYLSRLRALVTENEEFNVTTITAGDDPIGEIAAEMDRLPFLSPLRFLDVRGLMLHKLSEKEVREFCALLSSCPEGLIVVFYFFECDIPFSGNIPHTQKRLNTLEVYKNLPENAVVVNFAHPTEEELCTYYEAKFKSRGVQAARALIALFCRRGKDMTLLENESEKLIALAASGDGVITQDMVEQALPELTETVIYKLSDAIENCDACRALSEYGVLRRMKFEPIVLLASLSRAVANLLLVKGDLDEASAEKNFGIKPFRYRALKQRAAKMQKEDLVLCQLLISETDRKFKNTALDPDILFESLIVSVCRRLSGKAS